MTRRSLLASVGFAPSAAASAPQDHIRTTNVVAGPRAAYFPNVPLWTHEHKQVRFYDDLIQGKIVVITFMFADCDGICPTVTSNLRKVQDLLAPRVGRDIFMYSITLKPKQDTPDVLSHYAAMHQLKPGWQLLTGRPADVEILRRKLGFVDADPQVDADVSQHIGIVRFGNEALDRWSACPALFSPGEIVKRILRMEDSRKRV